MAENRLTVYGKLQAFILKSLVLCIVLRLYALLTNVISVAREQGLSNIGESISSELNTILSHRGALRFPSSNSILGFFKGILPPTVVFFLLYCVAGEYVGGLVSFLFANYLYDRYRWSIGKTLAWSYYLGYLKYAFEKSDQAIPTRVTTDSYDVPGLFILIPRNGEVGDKVKDKNDRVCYKGKYAEQQRDVTGNLDRCFHQSLYSVECRQPERKSFYALLEYPPAIQHLWTMSNPSSSCFQYTRLSITERNNQIRLFYSTLQDILERCEDELTTNDSRKLKIRDFIHIVPVDGDGKDIAGPLIQKLEEMKEKDIASTISIRVERHDSNTEDVPKHDVESCSKLIEGN